MNIEKVKVYGLNESIIASGYPMKVVINDEARRDRSFVRASKLGGTPTGSGHDCFLKGINVQADLTCSQSMHMQILRYHFFDIISSQSKMHKLLQMNVKQSCNKYVSEDSIFNLMQEIDAYNEDKTEENYLRVIYNCPMGLELTFRFTTNYLQLKTIYKQRKNHKLPEWKEFCKWIITLPGFKELTGLGD